MANSTIKAPRFNAISEHLSVNSSTPRTIPVTNAMYFIVVGRGSNLQGGLYFADYRNNSVSPIVADSDLTLSWDTLNSNISITSTTSGYKYLSIYQL